MVDTLERMAAVRELVDGAGAPGLVTDRVVERLVAIGARADADGLVVRGALIRAGRHRGGNARLWARNLWAAVDRSREAIDRERGVGPDGGAL